MSRGIAFVRGVDDGRSAAAMMQAILDHGGRIVGVAPMHFKGYLVCAVFDLVEATTFGSVDRAAAAGHLTFLAYTA